MYYWSDTQRGVIEDFSDPEGPSQMVVPGPVSSGKSLVSAFAFAAFAAENWSGYDFLLCSHTMRQLRGSTINYLQQYSDIVDLNFRSRVGYWSMDSLYGDIENRFYTLAGRDSNAEFRARSYTAAGALVEEATTCKESFVNAVADRLRVPDAKLILITNPASPNHWLKTKWADSDWRPFTLEDNSSLTDKYLANLKKRYSGVDYKRMVSGEWASHEGLIWPKVNTGNPPLIDGRPDQYKGFFVGVDHAESGVTHALKIATLRSGRYFVVDEWRHDAKRQGAISFVEQARRVRQRFGSDISAAFIDPSKAGAIAAFQQVIPRSVGADNEVAQGLQFVRNAFDRDMLWISTTCSHLLSEIDNYRWDELAASVGEDRPIKENDHGADALRYGLYTIARGRARRNAVQRVGRNQAR